MVLWYTINNQFTIQLRKDFGGFKSAKGNDKYVTGQVYFRHHKDKIVSILRNSNSPLGHTQVTFTVPVKFEDEISKLVADFLEKNK